MCDSARDCLSSIPGHHGNFKKDSILYTAKGARWLAARRDAGFKDKDEFYILEVDYDMEIKVTEAYIKRFPKHAQIESVQSQLDRLRKDRTNG